MARQKARQGRAGDKTETINILGKGMRLYAYSIMKNVMQIFIPDPVDKGRACAPPIKFQIDFDHRL